MEQNTTVDFYVGLNGAARAVIERSTADPAELGIAQARVADLNRWRECLTDRPETIVLQHALNDVTVGLFLMASGLYGSAFISLRLFLELSLASVHFSANRLELAEWLNGSRDVSWAALSDREQGILSVRYAKAFFPELCTTVLNYNAIACKIYRELSEFVHGNHQAWGGSTDEITFNPGLHARWLSSFGEASLVVTYALCLRYMKELPKTAFVGLSDVVQSCLGHVEAVRDCLTGTKY